MWIKMTEFWLIAKPSLELRSTLRYLLVVLYSSDGCDCPRHCLLSWKYGHSILLLYCIMLLIIQHVAPYLAAVQITQITRLTTLLIGGAERNGPITLNTWKSIMLSKYSVWLSLSQPSHSLSIPCGRYLFISTSCIPIVTQPIPNADFPNGTLMLKLSFESFPLYKSYQQSE